MAAAEKKQADYSWGVGRPAEAAKNSKPSIWVSNGDETVALATFKSKAAAEAFIDMAGGLLAEGIPRERIESTTAELFG